MHIPKIIFPLAFLFINSWGCKNNETKPFNAKGDAPLKQNTQTGPNDSLSEQAGKSNDSKGTTQQASSLSLSSSAFKHQGEIPQKYTCQGADVSPPLSWKDAPAGTKSFAFILDDPDAPDPKAPQMTWVHWVVFDIPGNTKEFSEGIKQLPTGTKEGLNDWKVTEYKGPCPPIGRHRYFHKLFALDLSQLPSLDKPTEAELLKAMEGHILAKAELIGTYQKE